MNTTERGLFASRPPRPSGATRSIARYREKFAGAMAWRGILAMIFGLYAFSRAWDSTRGLALAFGVYVALEALAAFAAGVSLKNRSLLVIAAVDSATVAFFLLATEPGLLTFSHVLGAWAMLTGILELFAAGALRRSPAAERAQAAAGIVSIALGVGLAVFPELGPGDLAGWLGSMMTLYGCFCTLAAAQARFGAQHGWKPLPRS